MAGATDLALLNLPVLLVSAFVPDRVAVAQWGLTRVVAGLLRVLCVQTTLPLAAELGHDYAVGDRATAAKSVRPRLGAGDAAGERRGLRPVAVLAGFLRALDPWRHSLRPACSRCTLLIGTAAVAPSILALGYANYSNRGELLVRTKGLQLAVFLVLSAILIPSMGLLGAAIAVVASELLIQFGVLGTHHHPADAAASARHVAFLAVVMVAVTLAGWALGTAIRLALPLDRGRPVLRRMRAMAGGRRGRGQVRSRSKACARD